MSIKCLQQRVLKCVVRLTFNIMCNFVRLSGITVITVAEVNPISHRRSVEIVSRVNALMRSAHLRKKRCHTQCIWFYWPLRMCSVILLQSLFGYYARDILFFLLQYLHNRYLFFRLNHKWLFLYEKNNIPPISFIII